MAHPVHHLRARPRLLSAMGTGLIVALAVPGTPSLVTRGLLGWNVAAWLYLGMIGWMMFRADHDRMRRVAIAHAEGAASVLTVLLLAVVASLVGIVVELAAAKLPSAPHALPHILFALVTVVGSWLMVPTLFALNYASLYYRDDAGSGLHFPEAGADFKPDYADFLYFSFTLAVASQTADVSITTRPMRRLVLLQSVLSFAFNTAILALSINMAASLLT